MKRRTYKGTFTQLPPNGVAVGGTNPEGRHGKGFAKVMHDDFGYPYGIASGHYNRGYGIMTKELRSNMPAITKEQIIFQINQLYLYANKKKHLDFYIAYSASGRNLNYFTNLEMAEMFDQIEIPENIIFEEGFANLAPLKYPSVTTMLVYGRHHTDRFLNIRLCTLATAGKEWFDTNNIIENCSSLKVDDVTYKHDWYGIEEHAVDYDKVKANTYRGKLKTPDVLLRAIKLTRHSSI